ncbi:MAG: hypothetical protein JEZ07_08770 [Phycisphaerae bacterium]|nr:hypothetical protein [Phycisphaerae bacterium]
MKQYNPQLVMRQVSKKLLKTFFQENWNCCFNIDWDNLVKTQIQDIYDAFLKLPEERRRLLEVDLQDIHSIAASDSGISILVEQASLICIDINQELEKYESRYDMAMAVFLKHPDIWKEAVPIVHVEHLSKRFWYRRSNLPMTNSSPSQMAIDAFKTDISAFYLQAQGRGQSCQVDIINRNEHQDYYFVYLSDHTDTDITWDNQGQLKRINRRHAFEIVFIYDVFQGTLDIYAQGGKKIIQPLQQIFAKEILGIDIDPQDNSTPYDVANLKQRSFTFATDPEDGISQVSVRMLKMSPLGNRKKKIIVKLPADGHPEEIYAFLDNDLNGEKLPLSVLQVERATISIKLNGYGRRKALTFDIGPKSSNLKSQPENIRQIGEKYLRRWGIDRSA